MIAARAIVASSGDSITLRKSYWPIRAYWATTFRPIPSTSRVTSRIRSGFSRTVAHPSGPSVVSMAYVGIVPPLPTRFQARDVVGLTGVRLGGEPRVEHLARDLGSGVSTPHRDPVG